MATSLAPVSIPANTWVDLYDATSIAGGTQIIIQNTGSAEVELTEASTEPPIPTASTGFNRLKPNDYVTNSSGNVGAWALSKEGTTLQVEEA